MPSGWNVLASGRHLKKEQRSLVFGSGASRSLSEDDFFAAGSAGRWASRLLYGSRSPTRPGAVRPPRAILAPVPLAKGQRPLDSRQEALAPWTPGGTGWDHQSAGRSRGQRK